MTFNASLGSSAGKILKNTLAFAKSGETLTIVTLTIVFPIKACASL